MFAFVPSYENQLCFFPAFVCHSASVAGIRPPKKFDIDQQHQVLDEMQLKNAIFALPSKPVKLEKHLKPM